jgi:MFS family permease
MSATRNDAVTRPEPSRSYRWLVLFFISLAMFGNYYIYDSINPLEGILKEQLGFSSGNFGWLNTSYSVAALVTLLLGGYLIDRIGLRKSIMIFSALCLFGAVLTAYKGSFATIVAGRAVLGLGAESMIVAITTALAKWFKGKELSFAFGLNLTIARLGSVAADRSPGWAHFAFFPNGDNAPPSWQGPLNIAVAAGVICIIAAFVYWILEKHAENRYYLGSAGSVDRLDVKSGFSFSYSYWFVVGLCFTFYSAIFPFRQFAIDLFSSKLLATGAATTEAIALKQGGDLNSLLPFSAMIATPLFGLLIDRIGRRATLMLFGSLLLIPAFLFIAYTNANLYLPVALLGIAFSLIPAAMWPSVAYIVEERRLGTAYALMTLIQQIGMAALPLLIGWSKDYAHAGMNNVEGYRLMLWILSSLGIVGFVLAVLLKKRESGPHAHGLETITTSSAPKSEAPA